MNILIEKCKQYHKYIIIGGVALLIVVGMAWQYLGANADYICTHLIEENGQCTNGAWGDWETISEEPGTIAGSVVTVMRRVYTGTMDSRLLEYFSNSRVGCATGYSATVSGGLTDQYYNFTTGTITTTSRVCQVSENQTIVRNDTTNEIIDDEIILGDVIIAGGTASTSVATVGTFEELNQYRIDQIDATIVAVPALVRHGEVSNIRWDSVETNWCDVTGENGDEWIHSTSTPQTSITGAEDSLPIIETVEYTLVCEAFTGDLITDTVRVGVLPTWNEQ